MSQVDNRFLLCGRPLAFGDAQQIRALKRLRALEEERAERDRKREAGELSEYRVQLSVVVVVEAADESEAESLAEQMLDVSDSSAYIDVREVSIVD